LARLPPARPARSAELDAHGVAVRHPEVARERAEDREDAVAERERQQLAPAGEHAREGAPRVRHELQRVRRRQRAEHVGDDRGAPARHRGRERVARDRREPLRRRRRIERRARRDHLAGCRERHRRRAPVARPADDLRRADDEHGDEVVPVVGGDDRVARLPALDHRLAHERIDGARREPEPPRVLLQELPEALPRLAVRPCTHRRLLDGANPLSTLEA
jgi:hypothetical protein